MLGKLIKHEWKRVWKVPAVLLVVLQLIALGSGLTFITPIWESDIPGMGLLVALIWGMFAIAVIGVGFAITIYLALQFYKSMYSDEGYLTHTLPVSSYHLLIAKSLIMIGWNILTGIGILLSMLVFGASAVVTLGLEWREISEGFSLMKEDILQFFSLQGIDWRVVTVTGIISGVVTLCYDAMLIISSVTIGQLVKKYRIAAAFGVGCIIVAVLSFIETIIQIPFSMGIYANTNVVDVMMKGIWPNILLYSIATIVLFVISEYIIRKKLNLE